jgi:hypothetical protein
MTLNLNNRGSVTVFNGSNPSVYFTGGRVGISNANPGFPLEIAGTGMRILGGTGSTNATTIYLNNTGAVSTTSTLQFVNSGHVIHCSDLLTGTYTGWGTNAAFGHQIYLVSGAVNAAAPFLMVQGGGVSGTQTLEFGRATSGKNSDAGKIGYGTYSTGASLDIVGAGTTTSNRLVRAWDNFTCLGTITYGSLVASSDSNLKDVIGPIGDPLENLCRLKPVKFFWKTDTERDRIQRGFIAQEVQPVFPDLVRESFDGSSLSMDYVGLIPILTGAIKELRRRNDELQARVEALEKL